MNVVIGDFEVLTEPAAPTSAPATSHAPAAAGGAPPDATPEVHPQQALALQLLDALRLWAH